VNLDVGECSDYLLFWRKVGALLELEVTYRTRQGKVAVNTAEVNEAACSLDTRLLGCVLSEKSNSSWGRPTFVLRLVVEGQRLGPALDS
jgi:hypothetical protein